MILGSRFGIGVFAVLGVVFAASGCGDDRGGGGNSCEYRGKIFGPGDAVPADVGCGSCSCLDGELACANEACVATCTYENQTYTYGQTFPSGDGCNTCTCEMNGEVSCTTLDCAPTCVYEGQQHAVGETFPASDGCNTCTCLARGGVSCTELDCSCDPAAEYNRSYVAYDATSCAATDFICPTNTTRFDSTCGCGCEQDAACPEAYDCTEPNACDVDALHAACPLSDFVF